MTAHSNTSDSPYHEPLAVTFFGISGSGKGTQTELLAKFLEEHDPTRQTLRVGMGTLARTFAGSGTSLANRVRDVIEAGGLLPSVVPAYLLVDHLNRTVTGTEHLMLDGVCRRPAQSRMMDEIVRFLGYTELHAVVMELSEEEARERLRGRGRGDDDNPASLAERFKWYKAEAVPAIDALAECGWTMHHIDASPSIESIHETIIEKLELPV